MDHPVPTFACAALILLVVAVITASRARPVVQRARLIQNFTRNDQRHSGIGWATSER